MPVAPQSPRFVSVAEFRSRTDLSTSTIYRLIDQRLIVRPSRVSPGRVGWAADYVDNWLAERAGIRQVAA